MITILSDAVTASGREINMLMRRRIAIFMMLFLAMPVSGHSITRYDSPDQRSIMMVMLSVEHEVDIDPQALRLALQGYFNLKRQGLIRREGIVTLIDFDRPSDRERLFIIDVDNARVLYSSLVAHGKNSGEVYATSFSNMPGSNKSSLGFYLTENTYIGKNGYSLVLKGLEEGLNDMAEARSIVIHGAEYVSRDYIQRNGRLGRSEGCPAVSFEHCQDVIDLIKDGSCLFIYHNGKDYASASAILDPDMALDTGLSDNPA